MKKILSFIAALGLAFVFTVTEAGAQSVSAGFGLGASYPKAPDTVAFDSSVFVDFGINKYFALGIESGFGWIRRSSGDKVDLDGVSLTLTKSSNFYSFPLLGTMTVYIPVGEYESAFTPYISGGAGYSWTTLSGDMHETFHGFTWQAVLGVNFNLGSDANGMIVFLEGGYRGTMIEANINSKSYELDMSAPFIKLGLSFPLSSGDF